MSVTVTVENIEKEFGLYPALRGASLRVHGGELMAILGPSVPARPRCCAWLRAWSSRKPAA